MAEPTYGGWQTYCIVVRQPAGACPYNTFTYTTTGQLVQANWIWRVSTLMADAAYKSFTAFIGANPAIECIVFDADTGEGRYYDGTQAGDDDIYWDLRQFACGKIQDYNAGNERTIVKDYDIGEMWAQDAKEMQYNVTFSTNKLWIPYRKVTPARTSPLFNQYGFLGTGVLEIANYNADNTDYYIVIFYTKDHTSDATKVATSEIIPCAKFEKFNIVGKSDDLIRIELSGHGLLMLTIPSDYENVFNYTPPT